MLILSLIEGLIPRELPQLIKSIFLPYYMYTVYGITPMVLIKTYPGEFKEEDFP